MIVRGVTKTPICGHVLRAVHRWVEPPFFGYMVLDSRKLDMIVDCAVADVAQLVEHQFVALKVASSILVVRPVIRSPPARCGRA